VSLLKSQERRENLVQKRIDEEIVAMIFTNLVNGELTDSRNSDTAPPKKTRLRKT
jgi:hypothetical protein